jgi:ketosteroid isomerase-like protein
MNQSIFCLSAFSLMKSFIFLISFLLSIHLSFAQTAADKQAIEQVLDKQIQSWNKGDIPAFMETYWNSDSLKFIGKNGIVYGWQNTLDRYLKNYPDAASRGTLRFEILSVDMISKDAAFVIGKFFLTRPQKGDASGHFSLLCRKMKGKWLIVTDHSS